MTSRDSGRVGAGVYIRAIERIYYPNIEPFDNNVTTIMRREGMPTRTLFRRLSNRNARMFRRKINGGGLVLTVSS